MAAGLYPRTRHREAAVVEGSNRGAVVSSALVLRRSAVCLKMFAMPGTDMIANRPCGGKESGLVTDSRLHNPQREEAHLESDGAIHCLMAGSDNRGLE